VDVWKVSSFEARDRELTRAIEKARGERPWFISTGMQDESERASLPREAIRLHCVSAYPCPMEEANLGAIELHEGYSDHTRCIYTGGLAVAAGADYLEVHYRLDHTSRTCPDYPVALSPNQLASYVYFARTAALAHGDGSKVIQECERENLRYRVIS
jgi:sialic acid synthase SpsE